MSPHIMVKMVCVLAVVLLLFNGGNGDANKDKEECAGQLIGLATCLPYVVVGGTAKTPTPECCNGLKQVLNTNKKCLCVIIQHRNDPDLGLNINASLALGLPSVCHAPANVSQCPALLNLPPNSPDAQIFYQYGHQSSSIASSPVPAISPTVAVSPARGAGSRPTTQSTSDSPRAAKWAVAAIVLLLSNFASNLF